MDDAPRPPASPLVVAGMHRSGTSLVASWLAAAGVEMGERLLPADDGNPTGYFEDEAFLDLDRRILQAAVPADEPGHADWGWTESERFDLGRSGRADDFAAEARALVAAAAADARGRRWGWKDPRTTLLLDFWDPLLPAARYLLLYRFPWEVADSMQRLGAAVFLDHPTYAYRIWAFYNRALLDFCRRHRERCLLVSVDALHHQVPRMPRFAALLAERLGIAATAGDLAARRAPELFRRTAPGDPLPGLIARVHPECTELLAELDALADLPATGLWDASPRPCPRLADPAPGLSVVIPCYDLGEVLVEAVASVERAVPAPSELLIVNDGSREPRTLEVLAALRQAGYRVIDQENAGLAAARNRGFAAATGRYLLPLDADNRLRPGFAAAALRVLDERPEVGVVYGDREEFGVRNGGVTVPELDLDGLLRANSIDACAVLRREVWEQCGGYDGAMPAPGWEDWDLWLGAAERGWHFHRIAAVAFDYRVRPGSMATGLHSAAVGVPLRHYMIDKHYDLYRRRLPELLTAQHEAGRVQAELTAAASERTRLEGERDRLYLELDLHRQRVAAMEATRAWRLREWVLRLRGRRRS